MNTQAITLLVLIGFIIFIVVVEIFQAIHNCRTKDRKDALENIVNKLMSAEKNPLGIYKSSVNSITSIDNIVIDRFAIGYTKSPKYGYEISTIYDYPNHKVNVTFSNQHPDDMFGAISRLTWTVNESLIKSRYYIDHLFHQVRIWEEEFHSEVQSGTDNETDRPSLN